eukprot:jgi/Mesen1/1478/ME000132S00420
MAGTKDAGKASKKKKKVAGATGKVAGVKETETRQDPDEQVFLARAQELREEGNKLFQAHEFGKAMDVYGAALKLAPAGHADRAIYHSNRAACLLQMRPVPYIEVVAECSHALQVHAGHPKALLRRAKALEALGKLELAETDLRTLLQVPAPADLSLFSFSLCIWRCYMCTYESVFISFYRPLPPFPFLTWKLAEQRCLVCSCPIACPSPPGALCLLGVCRQPHMEQT